MGKQFFEARQSDQSVAALRTLVGIPVSQIFSPGVDVWDSYVSSPHYSIPVENQGWVVIENIWRETPAEYLNYFQLKARHSKTPKGISTGKAKYIGEVLKYPISSVHIASLSPVVRIGVHEYTFSNRRYEDSVAYDRGIVFHRADGSKFAIWAQDSIAELMELSKHRGRVNAFMKKHPCRVCVE